MVPGFLILGTALSKPRCVCPHCCLLFSTQARADAALLGQCQCIDKPISEAVFTIARMVIAPPISFNIGVTVIKQNSVAHGGVFRISTVGYLFSALKHGVSHEHDSPLAGD